MKYFNHLLSVYRMTVYINYYCDAKLLNKLEPWFTCSNWNGCEIERFVESSNLTEQTVYAVTCVTSKVEPSVLTNNTPASPQSLKY